MSNLSEGRGRRGGERETPWHFLAAGARTNSSTLLGCHGKTAGPCGAVEAEDATILDLAGRLEVVDVRLHTRWGYWIVRGDHAVGCVYKTKYRPTRALPPPG